MLKFDEIKSIHGIKQQAGWIKTFWFNSFSYFLGHPAQKDTTKKSGKLPEEFVEWESVGGEPQEEQNAELFPGLLSGKWNHIDAW